jgi:hypothetical protein
MPRRDDDYDADDDGYDDRYGGVEPHRGTVVLVLGVLSLMACGLLGPVAWAMGSTDLKKMRAGRMDDRGEGETKAGYICGMIATIMMGIGVVLMVVWFLFVFLLIGAGAAAR